MKHTGKQILLMLLTVCLLLAVLPASAHAADMKSLNKAAVTLSGTSFVYKKQGRKPSVTVRCGGKTLVKNKDYTVTYQNNKTVGKAVVIVRGKGKYRGVKKRAFTIIPQTTSVRALYGRFNSMTVKWKKQDVQASGYQIQYSLTPDFSKGKRSVTIYGHKKTKWEINGLKQGRTYYVRIRTFKSVNDKRYYSKWSSAKSTATKLTEASEGLDLAAVNAGISLQILKERTVSEGAGNSLVSAISLYEDLAMASNGTGGTTRAELENYLGDSLDMVNHAVAQFNSSLPPSIHVANSVWINREYGLLNLDFASQAENIYGAQVESVPFDPETAARINAWVKEHTNGMIPELIDHLDPSEVMHLLNAVAFESEWKQPYETAHITKDTFTDADGIAQACIMLKSTEKEYVDLTDAAGKVIAYGFVRPYQDGKTAFLGLLPQPGCSTQDILNLLDGTAYKQMYQNKRRYINGTLYAGIPEFSMDDKIDLGPYLQAAGVEQAFLPGADFSGMLEEFRDLYIDSVLQKTHIEVDRYGTKAAAATDILIKEGAAPFANKDLYLILNRPFVYAVVDYETGLPYFMGVEASLK